MGAPPRAGAVQRDVDGYDYCEESNPDNCCFGLFSCWGFRGKAGQPLLHQGGRAAEEPAWYARAAGKAKPLLERAATKLESYDCTGMSRRARSRSTRGGRRPAAGFGYGPEDYALNFEPDGAWFEDEGRPERPMFASRKGLA